MSILRYWLPYAAFLIVGFAEAKPAYWYVWQSRTNGQVVCAQTTPGPGWVQLRGPFVNVQCNK